MNIETRNAKGKKVNIVQLSPNILQEGRAWIL